VSLRGVLSRTRRVACWSLGILACSGLCACAKDLVTQCEKAFKEHDSAKAASICEQAYAKTNSPKVAGWASSAHFNVGHDDRVLEIAAGTAKEQRAGTVFLMAGKVLQKRNQAGRALGAFTRALDEFEADRDHDGAAKTSYALFRSYWSDSRYRQALRYGKLSYREAQAAGDDEQVGVALMAIFGVLYAIGDVDAGAVFLAEARELHGLKSDTNKAFLSFKEGLLQQVQGHQALAVERYQEAIDLSNRANLPDVRWAAGLNLVEAALDEGRLDLAEQHLAAAKAEVKGAGARNLNGRISLLFRAARLDRQRGRFEQAHRGIEEALALNPGQELSWKLQQERGLTFEAQGRIREAEESYQRAIATVESMREEAQFDDMKSWLLASKREPFEHLFLLRAGSNRSIAALEVAERARARTFLDAFVAANASSARHESKPSATDVEATTMQAETALERADALSAILARTSLVAHRRASAIDRVLSALRNDQAWMYFEAQGSLWLISLSNGRVGTHRLDVSTEQLKLQVDRMLLDPCVENAESLAGLLVPSRALPPAGAELYLIPSQSLSRLPFGALRVSGRYLAENYVLHYVPSLSALVSIRRAKAAQGGALALGDPRGDLPQARAEAQAVSQALGGTLLIGAEATRDRIRRLAPSSVLHFAAHSGVGQSGAWLAVADGLVSSRDILDWGLKARLVVLSSCASSASRGPELWGSIAGSFLAAGSRGVVAALWSVDDRASRELFSKFYDSKAQERPALALASAQRAFVKSGRPASEWAAFIAIGE